MTDSDADVPSPDATATPISPPSFGARDPADADVIEKQFAGLGIAVAGVFPEPSGWDDGPVAVPVPIPVVVVGGGDEDAGEKPRAPAPTGMGAADARLRFPRRLGEPDCTYYLKFGTCRFGMKCKFNHPARKKRSSRARESGSSGSNSSSNKTFSPDDDQAPREEFEGLVPDISDPMGAKDKRKEPFSEGSGQDECKYYSTPGGCKFGKACKYLHLEGKQGKLEAEKIELNFLGLPLRPGEKECPYYMRTGSCKFATSCKFHHPDPTNEPSKEPLLENGNGDNPQKNVQGPSEPSIPIWPGQIALNEQHVSFLAPAPSYSSGVVPPQGLYQSPEWSGYHQVPLNPYYRPGVPFPHFPVPHMNHSVYKRADVQGPQQPPSDEYPERSGQPECQHFVKSGFCKYRMKCRFHHPRSREPAPLTGLSPVGLPIKPDQPVCTYYGRFGICKYGPACMFNHPFSFRPPVPASGPPIPGQYPTPGKFSI